MAKQKKNINDPFYEREQANYPSPIPSREYIMEYLRERGRPARRDEILDELGLTAEPQQEALRRRLRAMERDGQLMFNRRGGYGLIEKMDLIRGHVIGHRDGYGFLIPDEGGHDLFLSAHQMRAVFDGDKVLARIKSIDRKGRYEGQIVEVLERNTNELVGRYLVENGVSFVAPENRRISQDIIIPTGQEGAAKPGQYVVATLTSPPTLRTQAVGQITEILGEHMAPGLEIDVAIRTYELPHSWSETVLAEAAQFKETVQEKDKLDRVDLRAKPFVTIDGEDAKDFDDAVYCEQKPRGGWLLYVAIADVSHYVKPNSSLDEEAQLRGNSVYFPGEVIPMLPEVLSNGLCSLKPNTDRLSLVCEMSVSASGKLTAYRFYEAVIHSHARMTYTNVNAILVKKHATLRKQYKSLVPHLENLHNLYKILHEKRIARGALDFDTVETKIVFGAGRKIKAIIPQERNEAHKLIEEAMLLANVAAAKFLKQHEIPSLYRIHEGPAEEKLNNLRKFLGELGLSLQGGKKPRPKDYANLLSEIAHRTDAHLIQTVVLRSLSQAVYSPDNNGHFGLAYEGYTHFTSPIRRYPDLLVHRAIRNQLENNAPVQSLDQEKMVQLGEHCSRTERRADEATRDVVDWLKCEYMQSHVGEEFEGIIVGVTGFGLFVELTDIYVEGLVHVTALSNDYYHFDPSKQRLTGERTGISYRLADPLRVLVARVNLEDRQIDFDLTNKKKTKAENPKPKKKRRKKVKKTTAD